jgi:hypothetical protein
MLVIDYRTGAVILLAVCCLVLVYLLYRTYQTKGWVRLDAVVVGHVNDWLEGYSYDLRVTYEYEGEKYTEVALSWFFVSTRRKIGQEIKVLINPRRPHISVLYY